jgi:hypothetical protein
MPIDYDIVPEAPQVRVVATGAVTMAAMIAVFDRIAADPCFDSFFTLTVDMREASYTAELADGDALAAVLKQKKSNFQNRLALVVPQSLLFMGRLYCSLVTVGGFDKIRCFTDMEQAEDWCRA